MTLANDTKSSALEHFRAWSNYLLVTTVAALGWVTTQQPDMVVGLRIGSTTAFAASIVFGIFTLALIPLVEEQRGRDESIYQAKVRATPLLISKWPRMKLKYACWPQHVLFLVGTVLYTIGSVLKFV